MNIWSMHVIPAVSSFVVGYLLSYRNHGLAIRRDAANRRREFRVAIRSVFLRFDNVHSKNLSKIFDESLPRVRELCFGIIDDIGYIHRRAFERDLDRYCAIKHSDFELPRQNLTPAETPAYVHANELKRKEMIVGIKEILSRIAKHAT